MGAFNIPDFTDTPDEVYMKKGPFRLRSGAIYIGDWQ